MKKLKNIGDKHAYLIYAHNNFKLLELLLSSIDYELNDIYLHIDAKVGDITSLSNRLTSCVKYSNLYILEERMSIRWGGVSQIKVELHLFRSASSKGCYKYYHLLSGVDMPLLSQERIHSFFEEHQGEEFITFASAFDEGRVRYIHPLHPMRSKKLNSLINIIFNRVAVRLQQIVGYDRLKGKNLIIKKGSNWCSVTDSATRYIIDEMERNITWYRYAHGPDEFYKQTALYNSPFRESISPLGNLRLIDWSRSKGSSPHTFTSSDYAMLSGEKVALFARKFDETLDFNIVELLYKNIKTK